MPLPWTRRQFLAGATALVAARCVHGQKNETRGQPPVTGLHEPGLESFDRMMLAFLAEHKLPGAALAVGKDGRLVYARGFGYANVDKKEPVQPAALFRIASVSKPVTAVAVLQLVERGKLRLEDKAFSLLKLAPHLEAGARPDPRLGRITVLELLRHTAGWDRDKSFDPIARPWDIAKALNIRPPVRPEHIVRYVMGRPLDFDPGERHAYSNVGYLVLGRLIEAVSRRSYEEYVRKEVLTPLGITTMRLGKGALEERARGEVHYYDSQKRVGRAVVGPHIGDTVPLPDGAENLDGFEAHGGWIASAPDLVRIASAVDQSPRVRLLQERTLRAMVQRPEGAAGHEADGKPKDAYYGCGWMVRPVGDRGQANLWHTGLIAGTSALLVRRWDGLSWAVLFNTDADRECKHPADLIDGLVHQAADEVRDWPATDLFGKYLKP